MLVFSLCGQIQIKFKETLCGHLCAKKKSQCRNKMGAVDEPTDPREEVRLTLVQEWSNLFFLNIVSHLIFFIAK